MRNKLVEFYECDRREWQIHKSNKIMYTDINTWAHGLGNCNRMNLSELSVFGEEGSRSVAYHHTTLYVL